MIVGQKFELKTSLLQKILTKVMVLFVFGLALSVIVQFAIYKSEFQKFRTSEIEKAIDVLKPNLARAIWDVNEGIIHDVLNEIFVLPGVRAVYYQDSVFEIDLMENPSQSEAELRCDKLIPVDFEGYRLKGQIIPRGRADVCIQTGIKLSQIAVPYIKSMLPFFITILALLAAMSRSLWKEAILPITNLSSFLSSGKPIEDYDRWGLQSKPDKDEIDLLINELRSQSIALKNERAVIEASFPEIDEAIVQTDMAGNIVRSNASFHKMFQPDAGGAITNLNQVIPSALLYPDNISFEFQTPNNRIVEVKRTDIEAEKPNKASIYILRDDTERRKQQEREIHTSKMVALGTLSSGIAHDYNNVLAIILSQAELMQIENPDAQHLTPGLKEIEDAAYRGSALSKQLLTFARKQPLNLEKVSVSKAMQRVKRLARSMLDNRFQITINKSEDCIIQVDVGFFESALVNLIVNARDAMPHGGNVSFGWDFETDSAEKRCRLYVRDTGVGMDKSTLKRIQEPFFTTKAQGKGTGLGMAMVTSFVEQSMGELQVHSELGAGSTFEIYLPASTLERPNSKVDQQMESLAKRSDAKSILIVEDEESLRNVLVLYLTRIGYQVESVAGIQQLNQIDLTDRKYDLIICDGYLESSTALDIWKKFSNRAEAEKFVIMSGNLRFDTIEDMKVIKPLLTIEKPFKLGDFAKSIDVILNKISTKQTN